jgi:hypothetical protein
MRRLFETRHDPQAHKFEQDIHEPGKNPPFSFLDIAPRDVQAGNEIHESARQRWQQIAAYRPAALTVWRRSTCLRKPRSSRLCPHDFCARLRAKSALSTAATTGWVAPTGPTHVSARY